MGEDEDILLDAEKQQRGKMMIFPSDTPSKTHMDYTTYVPAWGLLRAEPTNPMGNPMLGSGVEGTIPLTSLTTGVGQMKLDAPPRYVR